MKAERFIELICHPEKVGNDDLRELATLIDRYPYFQAARVLYLKALHIFTNVRFRNELKAGTVHIPDHCQLYKYLNNLIEFDDPLAPQEEKETSLSDRVSDRIKEINGYLPVNTYGIPAYRKTSPVSEKEEDELLEIRFPVTDSEKPEASRERTSSFTSFPPKEENQKVISNPIRLDDIPGIINDYTEEETGAIPSQQPAYEAVVPSVNREYVIENIAVPSIDVSRSPDNVEETNLSDREQEKEAKDTEKPEIAEKPTPSLATQGPSQDVPELEGIYRLENIFPDENNDLSIEELAGQLKKKKAPAETSPEIPEKKKRDLIEKFIIEEPTIPRGNLDNVDNRDLSEESSTEKEDLFSETLAKIYIKQKLYEKAIATYIKLSLKYPEKSVYFAHRIEKIKEQINNNQ